MNWALNTYSHSTNYSRPKPIYRLWRFGNRLIEKVNNKAYPPSQIIRPFTKPFHLDYNNSRFGYICFLTVLDLWANKKAKYEYSFNRLIGQHQQAPCNSIDCKRTFGNGYQQQSRQTERH